jgi:hypothetical protein
MPYIIHTLILLQHRPDTSLARYIRMEAPTLARCRPRLVNKDRSAFVNHTYRKKDKAKDRDTPGQACPHISTTLRTSAKFVTRGLTPRGLNPIVRQSQSAWHAAHCDSDVSSTAVIKQTPLVHVVTSNMNAWEYVVSCWHLI